MAKTFVALDLAASIMTLPKFAGRQKSVRVECCFSPPRVNTRYDHDWRGWWNKAEVIGRCRPARRLSNDGQFERSSVCVDRGHSRHSNSVSFAMLVKTAKHVEQRSASGLICRYH